MLRRAGADLPFQAAGRTHGTPFEGWYWRIADAAAGRVVVALCGRMAGGWAVTALALHPNGEVHQAIAEPAAGRRGRFGVTAAGALAGDDRGLRAHIGPARLDVRLDGVERWPRRPFGAIGPAALLPAMPQYWQPVVLDGRAEGELTVAGRTVALSGARVYAEMNWGPAFAGDWWWGQAHTAGGALVAFAGGRVGLAAPTAVVVRLPGGDLIAAAPPLALVRARTGDGTWAVRARTGRHAIEIEAEGRDPHLLPVPEPGARAVRARSHQVLAGRLHVRVRRGGRVLLDDESGLAGLERGFSSPAPGAPRA